ncbi:MAG: hypothetical protein AVDCRST_MAG01-01-4046, partial [uncultured Rubrobacteraceae bacterium]
VLHPLELRRVRSFHFEHQPVGSRRHPAGPQLGERGDVLRGRPFGVEAVREVLARPVGV